MDIANSFGTKLVSYDHSFIDEVEIVKLRSLKNISSTDNGDDFVLEPCIPMEGVCMVRPIGFKN